MATKTRTEPIVMAIGMGHRNPQRGGASGEIDWTPSAARALQRRAQARGIVADLIAEHDGDSEPNWSNVDRQTAAARGMANIKKKRGRLDIVVFQHYNGGGAAGAHFLHVDGWSSPQRKADNPKDVRVCRNMAKEVGKTGSVGLLKPTWSGISDPQAGVMSERQSGAVKNIHGWRLGEFLAGDPYQASTVRVIAEAGSIDIAWERAFIRDMRWVELTYCEAILNGIEAEFGTFSDAPKPVPEPNPTPGFARPALIPALEAYRETPEALVPATVFDGQNWWFRIGRELHAAKQTPRNRHATDNSEPVGLDMVEGEPLFAWWGTVASNGRPCTYTTWGTRIWLDDTDFGVIDDGSARESE